MASTAVQPAKSRVSDDYRGTQQSTAEESTKSKQGTAAKDPSDMGEHRDPEQIAQLAYSYWEARGGTTGSAEEDWFRAEAELYGNASGKSE